MAGMDKRVTFKRLATVTDDYGNVKDGTSTTLFTVWGKIRPMQGRENLDAGALTATMPLELTVRSSSDTRGLTEADFAVINSVEYQIRAIDPDMRTGYLKLIIQKGVAI